MRHSHQTLTEDRVSESETAVFLVTHLPPFKHGLTSAQVCTTHSRAQTWQSSQFAKCTQEEVFCRNNIM